ncbi:hypothetical protein ACEQ8H_007944 [Pleosporales sp. CAS-2024a]
MGDGHIVLAEEGSFLIECWSFLMYTGDAFLVHICYKTGTNVDVAPDVVPFLSDTEVDRISFGSKAQLAAWYTYTALIWCMKFMLLFFYKRLLLGTAQAKFIKYLFWLCGATYLAVFLTITFGCHPIAENWQVRPPPSRTCAFKPQNFYVGGVLNVITDTLILAIPVPMLWRLRLPLSRKLGIGALLCTGLFVIAAAIIRAVLTLGSAPSGLNINRWGVRETFVGIIAVNAPILRPMFGRRFWTRNGFHESTRTEANKGWTSRSRYGNGTFELGSAVTSSRLEKRDAEAEVASNESQEDIIKRSLDNLHFGTGDIMVQTTYHVQSDKLDDTSSSSEMQGNHGY